jgi:hypothetical protein
MKEEEERSSSREGEEGRRTEKGRKRREREKGISSKLACLLIKCLPHIYKGGYNC